ncbi:MAG: M14 family zinc carboxypeptidase [Planctomycetota bacterium]|nr:M14 family zinc carboxypeptidase [Planctomycetota bacterium]
MTTIIGIASICALTFAPIASGQERARLRNLDQRDLQLEMTRLATEHPTLVTVIPVGESRGKRRIEALRVAGGELSVGRPALLIVANIDGPLVWTSALALDHVRELTSRYSTDARVKALLDTTTLYVIPRVDADAAEARFATPLYEETASGPGIDDDRDGRQGEDPPSDVDDDGKIAWMRVPDPLGEWMVDPLDARVSIKADRAKGQRGAFKLVREGRDGDKDGTASEDRPFDTVLNRNFPQGWIEHGANSGRFATDEPGARALCDFVLLHKDITLVLTYGALDNVVDKPKTEGKTPRLSTNPAEGIPEGDALVLAELGKRFTAVGRAVKGDGKDAGTFQAWAQAQRGLWTVNVNPWSMPLDEAAPKKDGDSTTTPKKDGESNTPAKKEGDTAPTLEKEGDTAAPRKKGDDKETPSDDSKRLRWIDAKDESARFIAWKKFAHPELGEVEIGGFAPYATVEPPDADRAEIASKNTEAVLQLAESLPRARLVDVTATDLGAGLWQIEGALANDSMLPYASALAVRTEGVRPVRVALALPNGATLLAGNKQELVRDLPGSGGRKEFRWIVRGAAPSALTVSIDSDGMGAASVIPEVK